MDYQSVKLIYRNIQTKSMYSFVPNQYLNAAVIFMAAVIISKVVQWITQNIVLKITAKTKTDFDDILVEKTSPILFYTLILIGLKLAISTIDLTNNVGQIVTTITTTIIYLTVIYVVAVAVDLFLVRFGTKFTEKTKSSMDDQVLNLIHKASTIAIWIVGLLLILSLWGVQIAPLLASLGVAGIAIAFALQTSLGNVFGGISLILDKNIKIGDVIDVSNDGMQMGKVKDIGLRSTKIQTFDNEVIIVPNGQLSESTFKNIAQPNNKQRIVIPFGVAYGSNIEKVKKVALSVIPKIPALDDSETPSVKFLEMADSSLNFKLYFYITDFKQKLTAIDVANTELYNALNKAKIEIPFPQMDVHMKK